MPIRWHLDDPDLLRAAIRFTAAELGFSERLIEKDYFCTVVLEDLATAADTLVFKGGTCLAKVHSGFYRLSEDLDFSLDMPPDAGRQARSRAAAPIKQRLEAISDRLPGFHLAEPLKGSNSSRQYNGRVAYGSLLANENGSIRFEIGLREPILEEARLAGARTAVLDPIGGGELVEPVMVRCLSRREAMAEKIRAALSRREIAIRDFFDLDHAVRLGTLDPFETRVRDLLKRKLAVPGNDPVDLSRARFSRLERQIESELRPVLRGSDFVAFDLERAIDLVRSIADELT